MNALTAWLVPLALSATEAASAPAVVMGPQHPRSFASLIAASGFVGPLMMILTLIALVMVVRRFIELRFARLAPASLQKALERDIHGKKLDDALKEAAASRTFLGELVAGGLYLRASGLDEMLANVERTAVKESQRLGNRVANLARLGGAVLLIGLFGMTIALINVFMIIAVLKAPTLADFALGAGESLMCVALAFFVALFCFSAFFVLDSRVTKGTLAVREIAEEMIRLV